ncbi:MAG TPA: hypothetical protein VI248_00440 [Kineosporiaceae bacterium]
MAGSTLAERLRAARARSFVGRNAELSAYARALRADPPPFSLAWIHGPGGIGKSALLHRLADEAHAAGRPTVLFDAGMIDPTPGGVVRAVQERLPSGAVLSSPGLALHIDTAERLAPVEGWLRTEFFPGLSADGLIVVAGRRAPDSRWRSDLGWADQLRTFALHDLDVDDAVRYLVSRGIPEGDVPAVLERTHGHPLALALVADVWAQRERLRRPGTGLGPEELQDVVASLVERFLDDVPDAVHRRALQVLGHARVTTEALLRGTLGPSGTSVDAAVAEEAFAWLRGLSLVDLSGDGLAPHQLARTVLDDDLRWRDRESWLLLDQQVKAFYTERVLTSRGAEQARATADLLWFHRRSPALGAYQEWDEAFSLWTQPARESDLSEILQLVAEHEGPESVRIHRAWWERQPEAFHVVRREPGVVHGFFVQLWLERPAGPGTAGEPGVRPDGAALVADVGDPVAKAAWELVERSVPLRPGEHIRVIRSWIGRDGYHRPCPTQQALTGDVTRIWVTEPGLAVTVAFAVDPNLWTPLFAYVDYARAGTGDATVGDRSYAAYLHDWRITSPAAWLDLLSARDQPGSTIGREGVASVDPQRHLGEGASVVLSRGQFEAAVRDAFRAADRPAELARNPLALSRLVRPGDDPGPALRALLVDAVATLAHDGRYGAATRALETTYLKGVRTQEAAAARLAVPFSTYRRHLAAGLRQVTEVLWEREVSGAAPPA